MRYRLEKFFYGRNGLDSLGKFQLCVGVAAYILSLLLSKLSDSGLGSALWAVSVVCMIHYLWRAMSRKLDKRAAENQKYLSAKRRVTDWFRTRKTRFEQRREYKFFKCPGCKAMLRVPRGKGSVQITCRKCGMRFSGRT